MDSTIEMECLVFSTSIRDKSDVEMISDIFDELPGMVDWSVDLDDWEKVLRIECMDLNPEFIRKLLQKRGIYIRELPK